MKKLAMFICSILFVTFLIAGCSKSAPKITDEEVIVSTYNMDIHFERLKTFTNAYMVFGGMELNHRDAISKISISGLHINNARSIYAMYPDFHLCKSPGAPIAQEAIRQLDIIPANAKVLKKLKKILDEAEKSPNQADERVCVKLEGEIIKLTSAKVRKANEDITDQLPPQARHNYYLIESAEIIDTKTALGCG